MNFEKAISIIQEVSGTQLTEDVVDAFMRLVDRGEFRAPDDPSEKTAGKTEEKTTPSENSVESEKGKEKK